MRNLYESLLDDFEEISKSQDKEIISKWCEENLSGKYNAVILKNNSIKLRGDVLIKNYKESTFPYPISTMNGNLAIEKCPNITSLDGLFTHITCVEGNFSINNCPKLTSLVGGPLIVSGSCSITGNNSLKTLEGAPTCYGTVYVMKNGKKFKESKIKELFQLPTRIVCSAEEDEPIIESVINEAINEPHVLEFVTQLKNDGYDVKKVLFDKFTIEWDLIDSSHVQEYNKIDNSTKTKIRNVISGKNRGIVLLWSNVHDKYIAAISSRKELFNLNPAIRVRSSGGYVQYWRECKSTELMDCVDMADSAVIITWSDTDAYMRIAKHNKRVDSRNGVVYNTPEYYEQIARENIERYKKIINQNKALKKNEDFDKLDNDIEAIVNAALKYTQKIRKEFKDDGSTRYIYAHIKIENIMSSIYGKSIYTGYRKGHSSYEGTDGLLYMYEQYVKSYIAAAAKGDKYYINKLNELRQDIDRLIKDLKITLGI